jgi:signal transduction histidine kinase
LGLIVARLYLTLYGVLFVTIALFQGGLFWVPEMLLHGSAQRHFERVMYGAYDLVEERLHATTPSHWDEVIEELEHQFHHGLAFYSLDQLDITDGQRERLLDGRLIFTEEGEQARFYKRVDESDRYLMIALGANPEQEEQDQAQGILYLIESRFLNSEREEWPAIVSELGRSFDLPLALISIDSPALPADRLEELEAGKLVVQGLDEKAETYLKRLGDTDQVFRAGPFKMPRLLYYFNYILLLTLALLVALAVYIWVRPVWRDLTRIDHGVGRFGTGDLDTRLEVRKRSALKPLADTFNAMAERMQRLIHSHRELTGAVSHELRTPIARLRFRIDMLAEPLNSVDRERHLNAMRKDIVELEELVSESLSYSRLDRERPELELETVVLDEWLQDLLAELEEELLAVTVTQVKSLGAQREVELDSRLMGRAVKNLLRNAHRHTCHRIQVAAYCHNGQAGVRVEDDGSGVPDHERERIFAPFARLDAARDRESGGVGLGLAIVSQIARWHGGRVWVEDSALGGACFVISWPVSDTIHE